MDRGIWQALVYSATDLDTAEHAACMDWTAHQLSLSFTISRSFSNSYPLSRLKRIFGIIYCYSYHFFELVSS